MQKLSESPSARARRMRWFHEARFGMFIHWGLYSTAGGKWDGRETGGAGEWLLTNGQIPPERYESLLPRFNPVRFDARRWVQIARDAGMRYIVITSKHHDGFGLWRSKVGDWNVASTPFQRDILKELATECRRQGIRLCFYHSIMDWHHPDYLPRRAWDKRPTAGARFDRYVDYMKAQLKELLTGYGPIGIVWFDGEWEQTWTHERGADLYAYCRSLQPATIVNNRVDKGRNGMQGLTVGDHFAGDYGTPEQEIPPSGLPGVDWESCMTMNDTWGFKFSDTNWKSADTLLKNLIDIASKGGNYLLNVGPTGEGEIPAASVERLAAMGAWLKRNGEAIYATQPGPFPKPLPWGRVTRRKNLLYLHVFDSRATEVSLPGLRAPIRRAWRLGDRERTALAVNAGPDGPVIEIGLRADEPIPVFVVETVGPMRIEPALRRQAAAGKLVLPAVDAEVHGQTARYESDKACIGFWTSASDSVSWEVLATVPGAYAVSLELACADDSPGAGFQVSVGGRSVSGVVPATGGWDQFRTIALGTIDLAAGKTTVRVAPTSKPGLGVMNLRSVTLTPVR